MSDDEPFTPKNVGELFMLHMPNGTKALMRVTEIVDDTHWSATMADLDDAMSAYPPVAAGVFYGAAGSAVGGCLRTRHTPTHRRH